MKSQFTVVGILALVGILAFSASAGAYTWSTYLEDIDVSTGTTDINLTYYFNATGTGGNYTNITLPCNVWELTNASTTFSIHATANQTFNLTVNGNAVNSSTALNWTDGNWSNTTLSDWGTTETDHYLNLSFESNITSNTVEINIFANDAALSSTWLSSYVSVAEAVLQSPEIEDQQAHSYFPVRDRVAVNNSLGYTITDISLNLTYPSQKISEPDSFVNITTMSTGTLSYNNISYQKYGPYVYGKANEEIDENDHEVKIRVNSHEVLTRMVYWDLVPTADDYEEYFSTLDYDTLTVKLNSVKIDWDEASIEMEDVTLVGGFNTFVFSWTEETAVAPVSVIGDWDWLYEEFGTGIALWLWIVIGIIAICIISAVAYAIIKK